MDGAVSWRQPVQVLCFPTESTAWLAYMLRRWHPQIQDEAIREQIRRDFAWHSARDSLVRAGLA